MSAIERDNEFYEDIDTLEQLINEHFDNPPLKFEELEVGMRVWDSEDCDYYTIAELLSHEFRDEYCIIFKGYEDYLDKFEENRFYRYEVKNEKQRT